MEQLLNDARASSIVTRILVGGSMVRATAQPNDFDCIIVLHADTQYETLRSDQLQVADARTARTRHLGDIFIAREGQSTLSLYIDFFSRNRNGKIIGMVEVTL
jgi:hypothetical protein